MSEASKSVVIVNEKGQLINARGVVKESDDHYAKLANRMVSTDTTEATINYGWNGAKSLKIDKDGEKGEKITLNAENVEVPSLFTVNGTEINDLIDAATDLAISGIIGTDSEIDVTKTRNVDSTSTTPRYTCQISLDSEFVNRITTVEDTLAALFRFKEAYSLGNGLQKLSGDENYIAVRPGEGLKFADELYPDEETARVVLDYDEIPTQDSRRPVTSGGIFNAISGGGLIKWSVSVDSKTGNMKLYDNTAEEV
jgi:hypothetical protein